MAHHEPEHGHGAHGHDPHGPLVEYDHPPIKTMAVWFVVLTIVVVGTIFGVVEYFRINTEREISKKEGDRVSLQVTEHRSREAKVLGSYGKGDKEGAYVVPIDKAIEIVASNPRLLDPLVVAAPPPPPLQPAPPPQPTPPPAPVQGTPK